MHLRVHRAAKEPAAAVRWAGEEVTGVLTACPACAGPQWGEGTSSSSMRVPVQEKVERSSELLKNHRAQSVGLGDAARAIQET